MHFLLPFLYLFRDRWVGGGMGWQKLGHDNGGPLRGGPTIWLLPTLAIDYWIGGLPFILVALAWVTWRHVFGWKLAGHSGMTPAPGEWEYAIVRHSYVAVSLALMQLVLPSLGLMPYIAAGLVHMVAATTIGRLLHDGKIPNKWAEISRGALFGAAIAIAAS